MLLTTEHQPNHATSPERRGTRTKPPLPTTLAKMVDVAGDPSGLLDRDHDQRDAGDDLVPAAEVHSPVEEHRQQPERPDDTRHDRTRNGGHAGQVDDGKQRDAAEEIEAV